MISCIGKIKEGHTIAEVAAEVKEVFGKGGNPDAPIPEEYVGFVNTPPTVDGYFRCAFEPAYAQAMEYIKSIDGAETVTLISIEWDGQRAYPVGTEEAPEELGYLASCPLYTPPEEP